MWAAPRRWKCFLSMPGWSPRANQETSGTAASRRRDDELGSRVKGNLRGPAGDEAGVFPGPLAGQERYLFRHPVTRVSHGRRPARLPHPGEVAVLGFPLVGLDPDGRVSKVRASPASRADALDDQQRAASRYRIAPGRWRSSHRGGPKSTKTP